MQIPTCLVTEEFRRWAFWNLRGNFTQPRNCTAWCDASWPGGCSLREQSAVQPRGLWCPESLHLLGGTCVRPSWLGRPFRSEAMGCGDAQFFADFVVFDANARSIRGMHNLLLITSSVRTTRAVQPVAQLAVRFSAWLARFQQLYSQRFQASLQQLVS